MMPSQYEDNNHLNFTIHQLNCNGLLSVNRAVELKLYMYSTKPDIMCLCETFIKSKSREQKFVGYHEPYSLYREYANRGGLSIIIKETINYKVINLQPFAGGHLECQAVTVQTEIGRVDILNLYNPHKVVRKEEFLHYLRQLHSSCILLGDFNAHSSLWEHGGRTDAAGRELEKLLSDEHADLGILNDEFLKTYTDNRTGTSSCLDLCIMSSNLQHLATMELGRDVGSDHLPVKSSFNFKLACTPIAIKKRWKVAEASWDTFHDLLSQSNNCSPWPTDASSANDMLVRRIISAAEKSVPKTSGKKHYNFTIHGITPECKQAIKDRQKAKGILFRSPTPENLEIFKQKEHQAKWKIKNARRESWKEFVNSISADTPNKEMWRKIKSIRSGKSFDSSYPIGSSVISMIDKANLFADHFTRNNDIVGEDDSEITDVVRRSIENVETLQQIEMVELIQVRRRLKNKSPGPDEVLNTFLKKLPDNLLTDLLHLFNISWCSGLVPDTWKLGEISPILKPERDPKLLESYRPICMLSTIGKLMEHIINKRIEHYLETNSKFKPSQMGFRHGKSTTDALLIIKNEIFQSLEKRHTCIVVHLDIAGAFDCVWHDGLLYKLIMLGVDGQTVNWIKNYLSNRRMAVRLGSVTSTSKEVTCGVPQGAVLSPILFNVMLHDLPDDEFVKNIIYADDVTLTVSGDDIISTVEKMQRYLNEISQWFHKWHFTLNPSKCSSQLFTRTRRVPHTSLHLNQVPIPLTTRKKVLGVIFDSPKLTFNAHVQHLKDILKRKTNIMKALSSRSFGCSRNTLRRIYIAFVRSKIEYASPVFADINAKSLKILEVIQNENLRLILGARQTSPVVSMQIDTFIPPLALRFKYLNLKWLIKLKQRGSNDFSVKQLNIGARTNQLSNFVRVALNDAVLLPFVPPPLVAVKEFSPYEPWIDLASNVELNLPVNINSPLSVNVEFDEFIEAQYPNYLCIYTDGSKITNGSTSAAVLIPSLRKAVNWLMTSNRTVIGAELFAIWQAIRLINADQYFEGRDIVILSDCKSALQLICEKYKPSFKMLVYSIQDALLTTHALKIKFQWVKSHCNIRYNEAVDELANIAHNNDRSTLVHLEIEETKKLLSLKFCSYWTRYWKSTVARTGTGSFLSNMTDKVLFKPYLSFKPRHLETTLTRFRLGHVGVNSHMFRFEMFGTDQCNVCGMNDTVEHFWLQCRRYSLARTNMYEALSEINVPLTIRNLLVPEDFPLSICRKIVHVAANYIAATNRWHEL